MVPRAAFVACLSLMSAAQALACSAMNLREDTLLENTPVYSENRRFVAIRREWNVPDFKSELAASVWNRALAEQPAVAWYEETRGGHRLIGEFAIEPRNLLVADSGRYLVAWENGSHGPCYPLIEPDDVVVTIVRSDGLLVRSLKATDVLTDHDLRQPAKFASAELRQDALVLVVGESPTWKERRVDLATGMLLDPKDDAWPNPRVVAAPALATSTRPLIDPPADCAAAWTQQGVVQIDPTAFFRALADAPLPTYPVVAAKARVYGTLAVEMLVSERGDVECVRSGALPFGVTQAAWKATRQWRFHPFRQDGVAVKAVGTIVLDFKLLPDTEWKEKLLPPFREASQ